MNSHLYIRVSLLNANLDNLTGLPDAAPRGRSLHFKMLIISMNGLLLCSRRCCDSYMRLTMLVLAFAAHLLAQPIYLAPAVQSVTGCDFHGHVGDSVRELLSVLLRHLEQEVSDSFGPGKLER